MGGQVADRQALTTQCIRTGLHVGPAAAGNLLGWKHDGVRSPHWSSNGSRNDTNKRIAVRSTSTQADGDDLHRTCPAGLGADGIRRAFTFSSRLPHQSDKLEIENVS